MRFRRLGNSGLVVSELCLGTNTFGGADSAAWRKLGGLHQDDVDEIVGRAVTAGINFLDTADMYAGGESEECVGQAIRNLGLCRDEVVIATKAGGRMGQGPNRLGASRAHLSRAIDASLRRLQTDHIDIFMVHYFDPATPLEETMRTLSDSVCAGKVRYLGCSNFAAWQLMKANGIAAREGLERFEVIEANWSAVSREIEREVVPLVLDQSLGVLVWGPLVGGLLSGKYGRNEKGAGVGRTGGAVPPVLDADNVFAAVDALSRIACEIEASTAQVALAWLLHKRAVTSVLFGARSAAQVDENVGAAAVKLTAEHMREIDAIAAPAQSFGEWMVQGSAKARDAYV